MLGKFTIQLSPREEKQQRAERAQEVAVIRRN